MSQPNPTDTFLQEAEDILAQIEQSALDALSRPKDEEAINRLFRSFHTIKGCGAMFGFDAVADFTHHVETILDEVRGGGLAMTPLLVDLILASKDHIAALLAGGPAEAGETIVETLQALLESPAKAEALWDPDREFSGGDAQEPLTTFRIAFRPKPGIAATGLDPASMLDELRALGACAIVANTMSVPPLDALQADQCYLSWDIALTSAADINAVRDIFIFVAEDSDISVESQPRKHRPNASRAPSAAAPDHEVAANLGERKGANASSTARVPSDKLDRLVNLVGELVMNQSRLVEAAASVDSADLAAPVEAIERLISELRDSVLSIRMMPIGPTFSQFRRLVHDLSHELGKEIELTTEGEDTELDKTVIDQLADPLVHLIRNSVDHGIESPEERAAAKKPRAGKIRLAASHEGARVVIAIQDDGRGLHPEKLRAKALEKGLIDANASLSESETFSLIFHPGFSTAAKVTSVSGRGVGMDVVRRQVEALRGSIRVASKPGQGVTLSLSLPLTLAIIEGLVVEVAGDRFIIPMAAVSENVELSARERASNNGRNLVHARGELVPYLRLRELFGIAGQEPDIAKVVIATRDGERLGLVVDRVLGSYQTVIQSLGRFYEEIEVVSGATIMGDGRVALILDVAGLERFDARRNDASRRKLVAAF